MGPLAWLENTSLGLWVSSSLWGYPIVLSAHAVGMAMLVGIALMLSFRVLGWADGVPVTSLSKYMQIARYGFFINLISGVALFIGSATVQWPNWSFRIKILLIFAGLALTSHLARVCLDGSGEITDTHKKLAGLAVFAWIGALIAGRMIAYTQEQNMDGLALWMESTFLHKMIKGGAWVWPTLETFHFIGLCLLLGSLLIVDLRIIGFSKSTPIKPVHAFIPITIAGFVINVVTGLLFLFGDPVRYFPNIAFQYKMLFVFLAGLNVLYFELRVHPEIEEKGEAVILGQDARIVAGLSLVFWISVIILGRMIPYVEQSRQ